ncbi:MAG: ribosome-associated protein [Flavobacteriales bacterium]|jgi:ribosome-associated protein
MSYNRPIDIERLKEVIITGIEDKKGEDIVVLDLRQIEHSVTDFFVICHANSNTQVNALADSVEDTVRKTLNDKPWHTEGHGNSEWILLDYVNVVVHIFQTEMRETYDLESLWGDALIHQITSK